MRGLSLLANLGVVGALLSAVGFVGAGCHDNDPERVSTDSTVGQDSVENDTDSIIIPTDDPDSAVADSTPEDTRPPVDTTPPEVGAFGYPCDEGTDCDSGFCITTANGRQCTRTCVEECPPFYDCREAPGVDATFLCLPRFVNLCDPCDEAVDCNEVGVAGNFCLSLAEKGSFCGVQCEEELDCPPGHVCRDVPVGGGGQAKQCVPSSNEACMCSPLAKQLQLSTTCFIENGNGKCEGSRFCTQNGLSLCDAAEPFPESCNGLDDNCNGQTDEFAPDYVCQLENEFGVCPGTGSCVDGTEECLGTAPGPEQCDSIDNDCDGDTDEGLCDDLDPCTEDFCNADGVCQNAPLTGTSCDDGSVCTQGDICAAGVCRGGPPTICDNDGNDCTNEFCDSVIGCTFELKGAGDDCDDGQLCTINATCNANGQCQGGQNKVLVEQSDGGCINPDVQCKQYQCDASNGQCIPFNQSNGSACGEPGQCSSGQCQNGLCQPGTSGNECTSEYNSDHAGGVPQCNSAFCSGGQCTLMDADQNQSCTGSASTCRERRCLSGSCELVNSPSGVGCPLSGDCSQGSCNGGGQCDVRQPQVCSTEVGFLFCTEDVPGTCASDGRCQPTEGSCQCTGACSSFCICCNIGGAFPAQLCLDFLFN